MERRNDMINKATQSNHASYSDIIKHLLYSFVDSINQSQVTLKKTLRSFMKPLTVLSATINLLKRRRPSLINLKCPLESIKDCLEILRQSIQEVKVVIEKLQTSIIFFQDKTNQSSFTYLRQSLKALNCSVRSLNLPLKNIKRHLTCMKQPIKSLQKNLTDLTFKKSTELTWKSDHIMFQLQEIKRSLEYSNEFLKIFKMTMKTLKCTLGTLQTSLATAVMQTDKKGYLKNSVDKISNRIERLKRYLSSIYTYAGTCKKELKILPQLVLLLETE